MNAGAFETSETLRNGEAEVLPRNKAMLAVLARRGLSMNLVAADVSPLHLNLGGVGGIRADSRRLLRFKVAKRDALIVGTSHEPTACGTGLQPVDPGGTRLQPARLGTDRRDGLQTRPTSHWFKVPNTRARLTRETS